MRIGIVSVTINIPAARSLKDKRSVVRHIKDRACGRMNVSVAEVGEQDRWQIAELAFVTVAGTHAIVEKRISQISQFVRSDPTYVLVKLNTEII
jgi:uncharacterized protein YlxP (DUF503 family)